MGEVLVPLLLAAFLALWFGALATLMTDQALDVDDRVRWILPVAFLPPVASIAFLVWGRRRRRAPASPPAATVPEGRRMSLTLRQEWRVARLAVAYLGVLAFCNLLGILIELEPSLIAVVERFSIPLRLLVLFAGVDMLALWVIALRMLASDRKLHPGARSDWLLPLVFLGPITAPIFLIWRWTRYVRWLPES